MNITSPKYIVIGDVHGDYIALERMLGKVNIVRNKHNPNKWISRSGYKAILLGDLNDYRSNNSLLSSWKALHIGMTLCESGLGTVLHSNHQEKLIQYMNNPYITINQGLERTVNELKSLDSSQLDKLRRWLLNRPLTFSFEIKGITYSCAHAYFPPLRLEKQDPNTYKSLCINGVLNDKGKRVCWWEYPELVDTKRVVLCGHYHVVVTKPHVVVIDGNCGTYHRGILMGYIPGKNKCISVLGSEWERKKNYIRESKVVCPY